MKNSQLIIVAVVLLLLLSACQEKREVKEKIAEGTVEPLGPTPSPTPTVESLELIEPMPTNVDKQLPDNMVPLFPFTEKICVSPVLFLPSDSSLTGREIEQAKQLLTKHLAVAQKRYQKLLGTTFCVDDKKEFVRHGKFDDLHYIPKEGDDETGSAYLITKELFERDGTDRYTSNAVYLVIYVRPETRPYSPASVLFGGGRTFNGAPNSGGGYVEMEYTALVKEVPYHFQTTLLHELSHAFGLTHVTCFGGNIDTSDSIMSYNQAHVSDGLVESKTPGIFTQEELFELYLNKRAFPYFDFDFSGIDVTRVSQCFLGYMKQAIGDYKYFPGVGYELFFNGNRVSDAEATLFSFANAKKNCKWNTENKKGIKVECRYNGKVFKVD